MIPLIFTLVFLSLGSYFVVKTRIWQVRTDGRDPWRVWYSWAAFWMFVISGVGAIGLVISNGVGYTNQISDQARISQYKENAVIYRTKAERLTEQFKGYLAVQYPKYEKSIFKLIKPNTVGVYVVKYPELHASETIMALVSKIQYLQNSVYDQQLNITQAQKDMRVRRSNPWFLGFLFP